MSDHRYWPPTRWLAFSTSEPPPRRTSSARQGREGDSGSETVGLSGTSATVKSWGRDQLGVGLSCADGGCRSCGRLGPHLGGVVAQGWTATLRGRSAPTQAVRFLAAAAAGHGWPSVLAVAVGTAVFPWLAARVGPSSRRATRTRAGERDSFRRSFPYGHLTHRSCACSNINFARKHSSPMNTIRKPRNDLLQMLIVVPMDGHSLTPPTGHCATGIRLFR